jgi:hypothetical protein
VPFQIIMIPLIILSSGIKVYGTIWGIAIVHAVLSMPFLTLVFRNYYKGIPQEIMSAAMMDSGSFWKIFREIILPMSGNIMIVVLILQVTSIWNGTNAQMNRMNRNVPAQRTFHSANAYPVIDESAIERTRLGNRIATEFQKPILSPSQRMPEHALSHALIHGSMVNGAGSEKIAPSRICAMVLNEVVMMM